MVASHGLSRAQDLAAALSNISAAVAPTGFLILHELTGALASCVWGLVEAEQHVNVLPVKKWKQKLTAAGFHEISTIRFLPHAAVILVVCGSLSHI